jgi:hypothetical protein
LFAEDHERIEERCLTLAERMGDQSVPTYAAGAIGAGPRSVGLDIKQLRIDRFAASSLANVDGSFTFAGASIPVRTVIGLAMSLPAYAPAVV